MAEYGFGEDDLFNNKEMLYTHVPHLEDKTKAFITQMVTIFFVIVTDVHR